jgi:hypothetical protein
MTTTTDVAVYKDGEIAETPVLLTKAAAKALNKKIISASNKLTGDVNKVAVDTKALLALVNEAQTGQIHKALDYASWTAWFKDTVRIEPANPVERKMLVRLMNGEGLPQRATAAALGISQKTADRDLDGVETSQGDSTTVTTATGKTYPKHPKQKAEPEAAEPEVLDVESEEIPDEGDPEPTVSTPATVLKEFGTEMDNLGIDAQALCDVVADECWAKARVRVAKAHLNPLQDVITTLTEIVDDLMSVAK